ncbi:hypothetical protein GCM10007385_35550 [Tateyamaria omphalii]|uniref:phage tail length tape measure family protein n=1 Tax=Tateyamaria omphalii TaxID=299262 RepID=UPI00167B0611|nr:phage tail length tape measure family protein [Tateyamaria omphalii]GGX63308.1 hypothetical protein GCM10007385_35550 [Tateyamaria omphalii]
MDIALLGVEVDSSGVVKGTRDLDRLGDQAARTERQTNKMATGVNRGMTGAGRAVEQFGQRAKVSSFNTANLAAQGNDVIVMALAMQNPLQLALQQGTQVSQVLNTMGSRGDIIRNLGAAFTSMINPVSLATIGIIAGGAALVQWGISAAGAGRDAKDFEDTIEDTSEAVEGYIDLLRSQDDAFDLGFGRFQDDLKRTSQAYKDLLAIAKVDAINSVAAATTALSESVTGFRLFSGDSMLQGAIPNAGDLLGIETGLRGNITAMKDAREEARQFLELLELVNTSDSLSSQLSAALQLRDAFVAIVGPAEDMTTQQLEFMRNLSLSIQQMEALAAATDDQAISQAAVSEEIRAGFEAAAAAQTTLTDETTEYISRMADAFEAASDLKEEIGDAAFEAVRLAGVDMAGPISAATLEAAKLAGTLEIAVSAAASLLNLQNSLEYSGRGGNPFRFGDPIGRDPNAGTGTLSADAQSLIDAANRRSRRRGGRGGGQSEAEKQRQKDLRATEKILNSLFTAQDTYNDALDQANRLYKIGLLPAGAYQEHLKQLKVELAEAEFGQVYQAIDDISQSMADAIVQGENFGDAIKNVMQQVAADILASGIRESLLQVFNIPSIAGGRRGGGLLSSLFAGLFDQGGNIPSGQFGIVGERGPELVSGPASVMGRQDFSNAMRGGGGAQKLEVGIHFENTGAMRAFVYDAAGQVVAESRPEIVSEAVGSVQRGARRSKNFLGV